MGEWVSDCCSMPNEHCVSNINWRTRCISMRWYWCQIYTYLDLFSASTQTQPFAVYNAAPLRTHYPDYQSPTLCSYSVKLCVKRRNSKYQYYNLLFDSTRGSTSRSTRIARNTLVTTPPIRLVLFLKMTHAHAMHLLIYSCWPLI